jgi:hypothetical protein
MYDFPDAPAAGTRFLVDQVIYEWTGREWRAVDFTPPYDQIVKSANIRSHAFFFDPTIPENVFEALSPDVPAAIGSQIVEARLTGWSQVYTIVPSHGTSRHAILLARDMLQFDGVDDGLGRSLQGWDILTENHDEVYVCAMIQPEALAQTHGTVVSITAGTQRVKVFGMIKQDGSVTVSVDNGVPIGSADAPVFFLDSVTTKVAFGSRQVVEWQYGYDTDQMAGFAINGSPIEKVPSGLPPAKVQTANPRYVYIGTDKGANYFHGGIGRIVVSGRIPDPETREAFVQWCMGVN